MAQDPHAALRTAVADRYRIERELGRGGMATVYLARDLKHARQVALKVLRQEIAVLFGPDRFRQEIQFAARLTHPNILALFDSDQAVGFLYYVMPYVPGGTLKDRLEGEGRLPLAEALDITQQVAAGLAYAHGQGIVHRDIKPGNILLSGGHAQIADFGIARVIRQAATSQQLTDSGLVPGTPEYMAPEQAVRASQVDGRADEYSLACVLYEMLVGDCPPRGVGGSGMVSRAIRAARRDVPVGVVRALERALGVDAATRYATVADFAAALAKDSVVGRAGGRVAGARRPVALALATIGVLAVVAWGAFRVAGAWSHGSGTVADTTRYAVLPFDQGPGVAPANDEQLLQDGLSRWAGITVADPFQVRDALARDGSVPLTDAAARRVVGDVGAARYVRAEVSRVGDSLRVYAGLHDISHGDTVLRSATVRIAGNAPAESVFARLADSLLFGGAGPGARLESRVGTSSRPARQAFVGGLDAIYRWDLSSADSSFAAAVRFDPDYAQASLWLAEVRSWSGEAEPLWQSAAERAAVGRSRLSARDQVVSDALIAAGRGDVEGSCRAWERLAAADGDDFVPWYGLGNCRRRDDVVLRDAKSPSGWRFRSSYHEATLAYIRAFQLLPSIHRSLSPQSYESVRQLLMTSGSSIRPGRALAPDTVRFAAYPAWGGDTLAFAPYPLRNLVVPATMTVALRHERELFHSVATSWAAAFPDSPDALEALAISLDLLGDPAALDTLRRARGRAAASADRFRLAANEVWMRLKFSLPNDPQGVAIARRLADSLLRRSDTPGVDPELVSGLAAVTGRAATAARYARAPVLAVEWGVPAPLLASAGPLLVFASLGGPADSLRALEGQVNSVIEQELDSAARSDARMMWLARAATLAFPDYRFATLVRLAGRGDYQVDADARYLAGDTAAVRRVFDDLRAMRRSAPPGSLTPDAIFAEASLLAALGDARGAARWLDQILSALPESDLRAIRGPANAGALVRAMGLRADLARRLGDGATAARWAGAVGLLWSDADPFLQPLVARMRAMSDSSVSQR